MLRLSLVLLAFCAGISVFAQIGDFSRSKRKYAGKFTYEHDPTERVIRSWYHYTVSATADGSFVLRVFHPEKGRLNTLATYGDEDLTERRGPFTDRYDDGSLRESGRYEKGRRTGPWSECSHGWPCRTGEYVEGLKEGVWRNGQNKGWMTYQAGVPHGPYVISDTLGTDTGYYEHGRLIKEARAATIDQHFPSLGDCIAHRPNEWMLDDAQIDTCSQRVMMRFLANTVRYPSEALDLGIEGPALVEFTVDQEGRVIDVYPLKGISAAMEKECIRSMTLCPVWQPGEQRGRKVKVRFVQPITFRLR